MEKFSFFQKSFPVVTQFINTIGFDMDVDKQQAHAEFHQESNWKAPLRMAIEMKYLPVPDQQEKNKDENDRVEDHNLVFANLRIKRKSCPVKLSQLKDRLSVKSAWHND